MIDVAADGTCLVNAVFTHASVQEYIRLRALPINDGFALRLHVIEIMQDLYPEQFTKLCVAMHQRRGEGKGNLRGEGELAEFVENKLRRRTYYLGIDFALMMSFVFGFEIHLVDNVESGDGQSTYTHAQY